MLLCVDVFCPSAPQVDPLDGTSLTAAGRNGAIAVIALAERGALFDPGCGSRYPQHRGRETGCCTRCRMLHSAR